MSKEKTIVELQEEIKNLKTEKKELEKKIKKLEKENKKFKEAVEKFRKSLMIEMPLMKIKAYPTQPNRPGGGGGKTAGNGIKKYPNRNYGNRSGISFESSRPKASSKNGKEICRGTRKETGKVKVSKKK